MSSLTSAVPDGQAGSATGDASGVTDPHKSFGDLEALKGASLAAGKGDVVSISGGSGLGKSTFLRCISCLEAPSSGRNLVAGEEASMRPDGTLASRRQFEERIRGGLGMVFQAFNLWTHRTLIENVAEVPVRVLDIPQDQARAPVMVLLVTQGMEFAREVSDRVIIRAGAKKKTPPTSWPAHRALTGQGNYSNPSPDGGANGQQQGD